MNAQGVENLDEINNKIRTCSNCILEYNLRTFNYVDFLSAIADTACQYAITAVDENKYQVAEFAAKTCKVMHPEFCISIQYVIAVYALYIVSIKQEKDNEANKYAKEFVDLPEDVTEAFSPRLRDALLEWMELDYE